jgi:hypothetical protein
MKKFRVMIEGENFNLTLNDQKGSFGFYTARFVEADNELQAQEKALALVISELKETFEDEHDLGTRLKTDEIDELSSFGDNLVPGSGFSWYPMGK